MRPTARRLLLPVVWLLELFVGGDHHRVLGEEPGFEDRHVDAASVASITSERTFAFVAAHSLGAFSLRERSGLFDDR